MWKPVLLIGSYAIVAILTFGHSYHTTCKADDKFVPVGIHSVCAVFVGAFWPIYWPASIAIDVMDPAKKWPVITFK